MACICSGIIIGILNLTGLSVRISEIIISLSGVNIIFALIATMVMLIILGTLFDFENARYVKIGSFIFIGTALVSMIVDIIIAKLSGGYGVNSQPLINLLILILFYLGIYFLAKEKSK